MNGTILNETVIVPVANVVETNVTNVTEELVLPATPGIEWILVGLGFVAVFACIYLVWTRKQDQINESTDRFNDGERTFKKGMEEMRYEVRQAMEDIEQASISIKADRDSFTKELTEAKQRINRTVASMDKQAEFFDATAKTTNSVLAEIKAIDEKIKEDNDRRRFEQKQTVEQAKTEILESMKDHAAHYDKKAQELRTTIQNRQYVTIATPKLTGVQKKVYEGLKAGKTQAQLAEELGVTRQYISNIKSTLIKKGEFEDPEVKEVVDIPVNDDVDSEQ